MIAWILGLGGLLTAFTRPGAMLGLGIAAAFAAGVAGLWWGSGWHRDTAKIWETHARGLEAAVQTRDARARSDAAQARRDAGALAAMREELGRAGFARAEVEAELAKAAGENSRLAGELAKAKKQTKWKATTNGKRKATSRRPRANGWSVRDVRVFRHARSKLNSRKSR